MSYSFEWCHLSLYGAENIVSCVNLAIFGILLKQTLHKFIGSSGTSVRIAVQVPHSHVTETKGCLLHVRISIIPQTFHTCARSFLLLRLTIRSPMLDTVPHI